MEWIAQYDAAKLDLSFTFTFTSTFDSDLYAILHDLFLLSRHDM
jgi:hypothetical protein